MAPRGFVTDKPARRVARYILQMTQEEFSAASRGSPMKRAKLRGLKRSAAVMLGNVGTAADAEVLTRGLDVPEPLVRDHAAWAPGRIDSPAAAAAPPPSPRHSGDAP